MAHSMGGRKVRLALERLENRLTPTVAPLPLDDFPVDQPPPVDALPPEPPGEYQPPEDGGFYSQIENGFFGAISGNDDGSGFLRIGNRFKTLPSAEVASLLKLPADQEVWLVNENSPVESPGDGGTGGDGGSGHGVPLPPPIEEVASISRAIPELGDDWLGELFPDGSQPWAPGDIPVDDLIGELPTDWVDNPEFVLPCLPVIVDLVPRDWNSLHGLRGILDSAQITVRLDKFAFTKGDKADDASAQVWGDLFLFSEPDQVWFNTRDGGVSPDTDCFVTDLKGLESLAQINWVFTESGTYDMGMSIEVTAQVGDKVETFNDRISLSVLVGDAPLEPVLVGAVAARGPAQVNIVDSATGEAKTSFIAYENYLGGVVTTVSDVTGDGIADYVTAPAGSGSPSHITVRDGADQHVIASFYSFPGYLGKIVISAGDVDGDGYSDIGVGVAENGAPNVVLFSGRSIAQGTPSVIESFYAFDPGYRGGIRMSMGDLDGNGLLDMAIASGAGTTPNVTTWQLRDTGAGFNLLSSYYAFDSGYRGGVSVTCTDVNGDGLDDVVTGSLEGAVPTVVVFDGHSDRVVKAFYPYMDYPADSRVINRGINVSAITDPATGKNSLVVAPVGGRASVFDNAEEWRNYYESHKGRPLPGGPDLTSDTPPEWWSGTGVLQIDFETQEIEKEWNLFPGFDGAVNIAAPLAN